MKVEIINNGRSVKVLDPIEFKVNGINYSVPSGFESDFASVPRVFWTLIPPWGKYNKAAVIHDFMYRHKVCSYKDADDFFLDQMKRDGVPASRRYAMYLSVRLYVICVLGYRSLLKKLKY